MLGLNTVLYARPFKANAPKFGAAPQKEQPEWETFKNDILKLPHGKAFLAGTPTDDYTEKTEDGGTVTYKVTLHQGRSFLGIKYERPTERRKPSIEMSREIGLLREGTNYRFWLTTPIPADSRRDGSELEWRFAVSQKAPSILAPLDAYDDSTSPEQLTYTLTTPQIAELQRDLTAPAQ